MLSEIILDSFKDLKFRLLYLKKPKREFLKRVGNYLRYLRKNDYFFRPEGIKKEDLANFIFFWRVLDFRLWEFPENWRIKQKRGYWGLFERLKILFNQKIERLKFRDFRKIISPKEGNGLAKLRYKLFQDCYSWLNVNYGGDFENYFEENKNPTDFAFNLLKLEKFRDYYSRKKKIYILKPNQLLYTEYILGRKNLKGFREELKELTAFADNLLPSLFVNEGVIIPEEELVEKIRKGKIIKKNSREEIELRVASILGCEAIKKELSLDYSFEVDFSLWNLGRKIKPKIKPLRIKSIFY